MQDKQKIIPRNYPSIAHLSGSKLLDREDDYAAKDFNDRLTIFNKRVNGDEIIVTEKLDGCNVGVYRISETEFECVIKKGYACRDNSQPFIQNFELYVKQHIEI